ncbi:hypothetical protein [Deinococcus sp. RM]|uniref:hypothetical protein n=1 Tax=Deinococcus sp. RM TaxID=2316359 RepID=UPI0011C23415|nr:hypothetical protein [Deinococcus sp. RM]
MRKAKVVLEVENAEQQHQSEQWCQATGVAINQRDNEGCGCCVNIYLLLAAEHDIQTLDSALQDCGAGVGYLTDPS